jgi:hypothetical protein
MVYVKSFATGLAAMIAVALLAAVIRVGILVLEVRMSSGPGGIGAIAGPVWPELMVSLLAFVAGFFWQYLRLSHKG